MDEKRDCPGQPVREALGGSVGVNSYNEEELHVQDEKSLVKKRAQNTTKLPPKQQADNCGSDGGAVPFRKLQTMLHMALQCNTGDCRELRTRIIKRLRSENSYRSDQDDESIVPMRDVVAALTELEGHGAVVSEFGQYFAV